MSKRDARLLLALWLAADAMFIILHVFYAFTPYLDHSFFNIEDDRSGGEATRYAKELWIAISLLMIGYLRRSILYISWALVFVYFVFDDMFQIHEIWGREIAIAFNYPAVIGLRPDDLGELTIHGIVIAILGPFILASYVWGHAAFRRFSRDLVALLLVLAFFGVVLDLVHIMVTQPTLHQIIGMVEDSGELVTLSVIVTFTLVALNLARDGSSRESPSLRFLRDDPDTAKPDDESEAPVDQGAARSRRRRSRRRRR